MKNTVRVWDLPTRVFHWCLVLCFVGLVATGQIGGDAMVWHFRTGYAIFSLLLFRLVWGFIGGYWSRFSVFVVGPLTIFRYARGTSMPTLVGHNPLGAMSVLALLLFPMLQVATGLMSDDEIATAGPLAKFLSGYWVNKATYYHTAIGQYVLYALVLLHIGAIIFYRTTRKEDLMPAMWHGDSVTFEPHISARDDVKSRFLALSIFVLCALLTASLVRWLG